MTTPNEMTYTPCPICLGTTWMQEPGVPATKHCPCTRGAPPHGWSPTGLTLGQIDRMVERERALDGDPSVPVERRRKVLAIIRKRLETAEKWLANEVVSR